MVDYTKYEEACQSAESVASGLVMAGVVKALARSVHQSFAVIAHCCHPVGY
jgi:hypothetical protein